MLKFPEACSAENLAALGLFSRIFHPHGDIEYIRDALENASAGSPKILGISVSVS
jgi:hypothetical protein